MSHREQILQQKLRANAQRIARLEYLAALPPELSAYLQRCSFVTSPEMDTFSLYFHHFAINDINPIPLSAENYRFQKFSWTEQVLEVFAAFGSEFDEIPAYFYSGRDCPLFCTSFGWARQNAETLFFVPEKVSKSSATYCPEELGVIATDFSVGIVADNYCGYLHHDPNPEEVVYTVASWSAISSLA